MCEYVCSGNLPAIVCLIHYLILSIQFRSSTKAQIRGVTQCALSIVAWVCSSPMGAGKVTIDWHLGGMGWKLLAL